MASYNRSSQFLPGPTEYQLIDNPVRGPVVRLQCPLCRSIYGVDASDVSAGGAVAVVCPKGDYDDADAVLRDWQPEDAKTLADFRV